MSFSAEARTVVNLTEHLSRLKSRAQEMSNKFSASQRGYFTPTEEDDALHLLVSYWQTRNALFELIHSLGAQDEDPEGWPADAFVIAFAAALALVDADHHFQGEEGLDQAGYTVAGVGDVDGDGRGDLLIGAWQSDRLDQPGRAYLLLTP